MQSALLEVMAERKISIGGKTYPLPKPFLVMATQNPIENEGTYPLPEAQVDRFLFKLIVDYPTVGEEAAVVGRAIGRPVEMRERVPTRSAGTRSGVNWMRRKLPRSAAASVLTVSVLARPGTPSTSR